MLLLPKLAAELTKAQLPRMPGKRRQWWGARCHPPDSQDGARAGAGPAVWWWSPGLGLGLGLVSWPVLVSWVSSFSFGALDWGAGKDREISVSTMTQRAGEPTGAADADVFASRSAPRCVVPRRALEPVPSSGRKPTPPFQGGRAPRAVHPPFPGAHGAGGGPVRSRKRLGFPGCPTHLKENVFTR